MKKRFKKILVWSGIFTLILIPVLIWSFFIEPNRLIVNSSQIKLTNWSKNLNGFKIVVISDLHAGSNYITEEKIREVVTLANAQDADVILMCGDYVSQQFFDRKQLKMPVETVFENLKGLKAEFGIFAAIGNQDDAVGNQIIRQQLEKIGYRVLDFETETIERKGEKLRIVGIPDTLRGGNSLYFQRIRASFSKNNDQGKVIVFGHNPDAIWAFTETLLVSPDLALVVFGHTHGGQVNLPIIGAPFVPTIYGQKYARGHIKDKGTDIFISSGIGTSAIPARLRVPPEISVLELSTEN